MTIMVLLGVLAQAGCGRGLAKSKPVPEAERASQSPGDGKTLYPVTASAPAETLPHNSGQPVVVPDCRLAVFEKEEVPGQYNGFLQFIGTEIRPGETVLPDQALVVKIGNEERKYRRLKEGDAVEAEQLLGMLDDHLIRTEVLSKRAKVVSAGAELAGLEKLQEESERRFQTQARLQNATSQEEYRSARFSWEKARADCKVHKETYTQALLELQQAQDLQRMHEIRAKIPGVIKTIFKNPGESVRNAEPVVQVHNLARLRVEGLVDVQYLPRLRAGMRAVVEPTLSDSPLQVLKGHLQEVTGVAVSRDPKNPRIVSSSEDGTVRVWDRVLGRESRVLRHPAGVRCVACTPAGMAGNLCLSGGSDGVARLWDLDGTSGTPTRELQDQHTGAITCVAFSPDGKFCATAGEDRLICVWETGTGRLRYRLPEGHRGAVTSLDFTPQAQLVSAGRDNTVRVWTLGEQGAVLQTTFDSRSGDVTRLGVSPDGRRVLFDLGKELRVLTLPEGMTQTTFQNPSEAASFSTFTLFSPDARLVLSAGASEGRLQLWRTPTSSARAPELRRLIAPEHAASTCAAFAPQGSFFVTGTRDRQVLVWPVPPREEIDRLFVAQVTQIEHAVESNAGQVRIRAEIANPELRLLPGTSVTLVIYPENP